MAITQDWGRIGIYKNMGHVEYWDGSNVEIVEESQLKSKDFALKSMYFYFHWYVLWISTLCLKRVTNENALVANL